MPSHAHGKTPLNTYRMKTHTVTDNMHMQDTYHTLVETRGGGGLQKTEAELTWQVVLA